MPGASWERAERVDVRQLDARIGASSRTLEPIDEHRESWYIMPVQLGVPPCRNDFRSHSTTHNEREI